MPRQDLYFIWLYLKFGLFIKLGFFHVLVELLLDPDQVLISRLPGHQTPERMMFFVRRVNSDRVWNNPGRFLLLDLFNHAERDEQLGHVPENVRVEREIVFCYV